ncbi:CBS domain-containing protein [Psychromonas sp. KJ10-10]
MKVHDALTLMLEHNIGCLPVIEESHIQGIFTLHDGIKALME